MNLYLYTWNRVFYSNGCVNYRICSLKKIAWDERFIRRLTAISRSDNFWLYSTVRMCLSSSMLTLPSEFTSAFSKNFSQAASHLTNLSAIVVFFANFCIKYSWNTKILSSFYPLKCFFVCFWLIFFHSNEILPPSQLIQQ